MRFLSYPDARSVANVIVDGAGTDNTVLTLSHWPKSGTPAALKADTSAAIVFNYLESPQFHVHADAVSNNHFDEDGLIGIFALLEPDLAVRHRRLLVDASRAGDFGVFETRQAARIVFTLFAYADADRSPLSAQVFALPHLDQAAELYRHLFVVLPRLLTNLDDYRALWEVEDSRLSASEALLEQGVVSIEEQPDLDLAIIRMPATEIDCHPFALHNRTVSSRLLLVGGGRVELRYRYESWVQMTSRRPAPRVDLTGLADELNHAERSGGRWVFVGVEHITPRLYLEGRHPTSIPVETVVQRVEHHLRTGLPAWDPYD